MTEEVISTDIIDSDTLQKIKERIDDLMDNGSSLDHAIAVVCSVNDFNPAQIQQLLIKKYNIKKEVEEEDYKDVKNDVGSYVMLKKNPGKEYEVINIINKENIVLNSLDDDSELKVKDTDIIPIVTETKMKELNEAQYTVSIDNLETTDAETLSQMLSLAGQAEQPVAEEVPMDAGIPGEIPAEEPVMDYEPTIPSTMDGPGFEAAEIDGMDVPAEEPADDMPVVDAEEDVVLPAENGVEEDVTIPADEDEILGEGVEEEISEEVLVPDSQKEEKSNPAPVEGEEPQGKQDWYVENFRDMYQSCNGDESAIDAKIDELQEMGNYSQAEADYFREHFTELYARAEKEMNEGAEVSDANIDAAIAETLRIAGIQLDEVSEEIADKGKKDLPVPPIGNANPVDREERIDVETKEVAPEQAPDYTEVSTEDVMGYDSSKGMEFPCNIKVEETVNKSKIDSIMETARRMYAKKDSSEWLALDRRYVEKLLKEGVGYTNASKMLLKAKAGK